MSPRALALCAVALAVVAGSGGCSASGDDPEGFSSGTATASAPAPSAEPSPQDEPTGPEAEPSPTFTQPFLPDGEERVIDLPTELPIEPPTDATEEERAVLAAAGRFMASWDAILFGAGDEQSGIFQTAVDPQLARLLNYLVESVSRRRVIVGEPTVIELRSVSVDGDSAEVDLCTTMRGWVQHEGGTPEPQPEVERLLLTMSRHDGEWRAADTAQTDPAPCQ